MYGFQRVKRNCMHQRELRFRTLAPFSKTKFIADMAQNCILDRTLLDSLLRLWSGILSPDDSSNPHVSCMVFHIVDSESLSESLSAMRILGLYRPFCELF
jgi:hypothetical protein